MTAYRLITDHYFIPEDLEQQRAYGPLSGSSFEERVVQEYALGKLRPTTEDVAICTSCATVGHKRLDCPKLV